MKSTNFERIIFTREMLHSRISFRDGEVKLGEKIHLPEEQAICKFHILGVAEDWGPQLNQGRSGARYAFDAFIARFLNVQSNKFFSGEAVCLHGWIQPEEEHTELHAALIEELDDLVADWAKRILENGGIPIVIGGGHNNAFPLIEASAKVFNTAIDVVNMDPHADTRALEGRHSGNPFSYAYESGFLKYYAVLGLHESYNNQYILDYLKKIKAYTSFYEDWLEKPFRFQADIDLVYDKHFHNYVGVELDLDSIAGMPTSAYTPSGISMEQARIYVRKMAALEKVCYLHLPEGAPSDEKEAAIVGKSLTYLALDFMKEYIKHHH